jgi:hypothetical protein
MRSLSNFINDTEENIIIPGGFMIPRSQMPQINDIDSFLRLLNRLEIKYEISPTSLRAIRPLQSMVDINKILTMKNLNIDKPVILSKENFLLDGHHRVFAMIERGYKQINAIKVNLDINKLFQLSQNHF